MWKEMTKTFGELVRDKRKTLGISIEEASARCGISGRGYGNIELNHAEPKLSNLLAIAAALDIDLGELNCLKPVPDTSEF